MAMLIFTTMGCVSLLSLWWLGTFCIFCQQERKVGWPQFRRQGRFALYAIAILAGSSLQQFHALASWLLLGRQACQRVAQRQSVALHSWALSLICQAPVHFQGVEHLPPGGEGCIYVANHTSSLDMSVAKCLPNRPHIVAVAKTAVAAVPGLGAMTYLAGGIFISRGKKGGGMQSLIEIGKQRLLEGLSVGVFPQGTRRVPVAGEPIQPFKRGAFALADATRARVVPLTVLYPRDFMTTGGSIRVIIHPAVTPRGDGDVEGLMQEVEVIVQAPILETLRKQR